MRVCQRADYNQEQCPDCIRAAAERESSTDLAFCMRRPCIPERAEWSLVDHCDEHTACKQRCDQCCGSGQIFFRALVTAHQPERYNVEQVFERDIQRHEQCDADDCAALTRRVTPLWIRHLKNE